MPDWFNQDTGPHRLWNRSFGRYHHGSIHLKMSYEDITLGMAHI